MKWHTVLKVHTITAIKSVQLVRNFDQFRNTIIGKLLALRKRILKAKTLFMYEVTAVFQKLFQP